MAGIEHREAGSLVLEVDTSIYELPAILRAGYKLTDRYHVSVTRCPTASGNVVVTLSAKSGASIPADLAGSFFNEILDQQIRENLHREVGPIRELIVAQAFAEGNLLDTLRDEGSYAEDPRGIGKG